MSPVTNQFESLVRDQRGRANIIKDIKESVEKDDAAALTKGGIEFNLSLLNSTWESLEKAHNRILEMSNHVDGFLEHEYSKSELYNVASAQRVSLLRTLTPLLEKASLDLSQTINLADQSLNSPTGGAHGHHSTGGPRQLSLDYTLNSSQIAQSAFSKPNLPKVEVPTFDGSYLEWLPFKHVFYAVIYTRTEIEEIIRVSILRSKVQGEAARLISGVPLLPGALKTSWDLLCERYDNNRLIFSAHFDILLGTPNLNDTPLSSHDLHRINTDIKESLDSLESIKAIVSENCEFLIVHVSTQRLDSRLKMKWEEHVGESTDYPTLKLFQSFIKIQARAQESLERTTRDVAQSHSISSNKKRAQLPNHLARVHVAAAPTTPSLSQITRAQSVEQPTL